MVKSNLASPPPPSLWRFCCAVIICGPGECVHYATNTHKRKHTHIKIHPHCQLGCSLLFARSLSLSLSCACTLSFSLLSHSPPPLNSADATHSPPPPWGGRVMHETWTAYSVQWLTQTANDIGNFHTVIWWMLREQTVEIRASLFASKLISASCIIIILH